MNKAVSIGLALLAISLAGCASGPTQTQASCESMGEIPMVHSNGAIEGCMSLREFQKREQLEMSCTRSGGEPSYKGVSIRGHLSLQGYGRIYEECDRPDSTIKVRVD